MESYEVMENKIYLMKVKRYQKQEFQKINLT